MLKADYYESSTWLTEEEKTALDAKDKARKETVSNINKRSNNFSLNLDDGYASLTLSNTSYVSYLSAIHISHRQLVQEPLAVLPSQLTIKPPPSETISCTIANNTYNSTLPQRMDDQPPPATSTTATATVSLANKSLSESEGRAGMVYQEMMATQAQR